MPNEMTDGQKGKLFNLWARCIAKPSEFLGMSVARSLKNINVKRCLKQFPEMSLSCQFSASFSLNSAKNSETAAEKLDSDKQERCRKIVRIEHEIRTLERRLERI